MSLSSLNTLLSSFFHRENSQFSGHSITVSSLRRAADFRANFSGQSFARLFGDISPNMSTSTVTTPVEMAAPLAP